MTSCCPVIQLMVYNTITRDNLKRSKVRIKFLTPLLFWIGFIQCNRLLVLHSTSCAHWNSDAKICSLSLWIYFNFSTQSACATPPLRLLLFKSSIPFTNQYISINYYKAITYLWRVLLGKKNSQLEVNNKGRMSKGKQQCAWSIRIPSLKFTSESLNCSAANLNSKVNSLIIFR